MIGRTLSHYEVLEKIGSGGMGEVFRARDTRLGRDVAIKVLSADVVADANRRRRFEQEARAASALNHPNIVHIYEIGEHEGTPFIAMEFIEGVTLRDLFASGALAPKKMLELAVQIAQGLAKAHAADIVHRDLKPENLMLTTDGHVKILDFGLAKLMSPAESDPEGPTFAKQGTDPGTVMGTASYMSPEQALGKPLDARTDVFSFGVVLYEMATGDAPFRGETPASLFDEILHKSPPATPQQLPTGVDPNQLPPA
jgi:serine/threonine protein kinase